MTRYARGPLPTLASADRKPVCQVCVSANPQLALCAHARRWPGRYGLASTRWHITQPAIRNEPEGFPVGSGTGCASCWRIVCRPGRPGGQDGGCGALRCCSPGLNGAIRGRARHQLRNTPVRVRSVAKQYACAREVRSPAITQTSCAWALIAQLAEPDVAQRLAVPKNDRGQAPWGHIWGHHEI